MRIGIDVGGTNTDAVLMDGETVVAAYKTPTTENVETGVIRALREVLGASGTDPAEIVAVMIGTTHFTNAVVERRRLLEVGAIRLGLPATRSLPPFSDWPGDLAQALGRHSWMLRGGHEFDGREIAPLDEKGLMEAIGEIRARGLRSVAISSVFSPVSATMESVLPKFCVRNFPTSQSRKAIRSGASGFWSVRTRRS